MTPEEKQRLEQIRERSLEAKRPQRYPERADWADIDFLLSFIIETSWQPIETAPEHGEFLVYMPDEPRRKTQAAEWHPNVKVIGNHFAFDLTKPTHWMPLPEPPQQNPPTNSP